MIASRVGHEVEADLADAEHRRAIDERLRHALADGPRPWVDVLEAAQGADPRVVAERLAANRWRVEPSTSSEPAPSWVPELHARDFEWYFTRRSAEALAAELEGPGRSVLCIGTPTVAFALLDHPPLRRITLVDRNPLTPGRHPGPSSLETITEELSAVHLPPGSYDAAVFDAPWYPAHLHHWLAVAAGAVRRGGTVSFALLRPLHRPHARADREAILTAARRLGPVTVAPGWFQYDSPRFEREALAASEVLVPSAWRRADRVDVTVLRPPEPTVAPSSTDQTWRRFVIGPQVVHLDTGAPEGPGDVLGPVGDRPDFRYPSISTRDPARARIGLWTSRSRVATVRRPALVAALLERLARTADPQALREAPGLRSLSPGDRSRLLDAIRTVIGVA